MAEKVPEPHVFGEAGAQVGGQEVEPREHEVYEVPVPARGSVEVKAERLPEQHENVLQSVVERCGARRRQPLSR